jgi:sulfotransferase family protein
MDLISIIGSGRSGSTFLEALLHRDKKVTAVGEISQIWEKGFLRDELCGCGRSFSRCEFWTEVIRDAFGSIGRADAERFDAIFSRARGSLLDLRMLLGGNSRIDPAFTDLARPLYASMWRIGGRNPVLDSSKWPAFVAATGELGQFRQHAIHMFRDARGNVYSYRRPKRRPQAKSREFEYIASSKSLFHAIARWKLLNMQARQYARRHRPTATVMYELLCARPEQVIGRLVEMIGLASGSTGTDWHSVSGNPMRFDPRARMVQPDARWRSEMKPVDRLVVRLLTGAQQKRLERAAAEWSQEPAAASAFVVAERISGEKL